MKKILILIFLCILTFTSCEDYLEENAVDRENTETAFKSEQGIDAIVNAAYVTLRSWYGKENGWDFTECGTDLYTWGLDCRSKSFTTYTNWLGDEVQVRMSAVWGELYSGVNTCNLILKKIDNASVQENFKKMRKAEVSFLRAHYYWLIVETWGGVYLSTEPTDSPSHNVYKSSVDDFYNVIFKDMDYALQNTPESTTEYGRITKPVVEAFLARLCLTRGKYSEAAEHAQNVIKNSNYSLIKRWDSIWSLNSYQNSEIIWAVVYSKDPTFTRSNLRDPFDIDANTNLPKEYNTAGLIQRDGGSHGHLEYEIRYENIGWGVQRDVSNGRGFQRWMPTKFFIDLFKEDMDQRFYGSFKDTWYCNQTADNIPKWKPFMYVDGKRVIVPKAQWQKPMFNIGDTAIYFSKKPIPASQKAKYNETDNFYFHPTKGYLIIDINDMYKPDGSPNDAIINRQYYFPITKKYMDPSRNDMMTQYSTRDANVIRLSEMYLIASEALLMQGNKAEALNYINTLRQMRAITGKEEQMNISESDLTIDFILDERGRELATETLRFFDLKRTGKLVERIKAYNIDAAPNISDFHSLRFIPQTQLDAVYNKSDFPQNPGY